MDPEIGIIRRNEIPAQTAPLNVASAEAFADAVAHRYVPQAVTVSHADLALAWEPPAQVNYFYDSPRIEISPAVTFEERFVFNRAPKKDVAKATAGAAGNGETEARRLFERLFSRHMRTAAFDSPGAASRQYDGALSGTRRIEILPRTDAVERILPRAAAAERTLPAKSEPAAAVPSATRDTGWGMPLAFPETTPKSVTLPAPEIKRVAEQVMREIDRRVIAQRERTGKR